MSTTAKSTTAKSTTAKSPKSKSPKSKSPKSKSSASNRKAKSFSGSRKKARANATISPGYGRVRINKIPVEILMPEMARERILTPLEFAGEYRKKVNIDVKVSGGGYMGRAEASATAISRSLVNWFRAKDLRNTIVEFDKHLISGDHRQSEPKKFGGPSARTRKQKSYR